MVGYSHWSILKRSWQAESCTGGSELRSGSSIQCSSFWWECVFSLASIREWQMSFEDRILRGNSNLRDTWLCITVAVRPSRRLWRTLFTVRCWDFYIDETRSESLPVSRTFA